MKILISVLSLLSLAIIGEGVYLYSDYQAKAQHDRALSQTLQDQAIKGDGVSDSIKALEGAFNTLTKRFQNSQEQNQAQSEELRQNQELLQRTQEQARIAVEGAKLAIASVQELKQGALAELTENQQQLIALKKEQLAWANNLDNRWHLHAKKHRNLNEFFQWMED